MRMIRYATALAAVLALLSLTLTAGETAAKPASKTVLCSTFPIYQIARNVAEGRAGLTLQLMLPAQLGCPHDYALTPQDMQKIAKADVLVVNGLGLEEFLGAPVGKANPAIAVIDASVGIADTLPYADGNHDEDADGHDHEEAAHDAKEAGHHPGEEHHHTGVNPHGFASPRMAARLTATIAAGLSKADPDGAALYAKNAGAYAARLNTLADNMSALGAKLKNPRIVQPHGVFDYLARDMGLTIVAVMQAHGQEPSAAQMIELVKTVKTEKAGAIVTEPQYPEKAGRVLAKETGIPVITLDPAASGPENAPLTYYETVMQRNMKTLQETLGTK